MPRNEEQRAAHTRYMREYRKNPEARARHNGFSRRYRLANLESITPKKRAEHLRRKFGITPNEYAAMLASQGGGCAICARSYTHRHLDVDHDHETGEIRGLLCIRCNRVVGQLEANPGLLEGAQAYLRASKRHLRVVDHAG